MNEYESKKPRLKLEYHRQKKIKKNILPVFFGAKSLPLRARGSSIGPLFLGIFGFLRS